MKNCYDVIIIGASIAGQKCALELSSSKLRRKIFLPILRYMPKFKF